MIFARVLHQTLCCTATECGDAIVNALACDRREPAVRKRELRSHVVVVIQERVVIVAHGALAGVISESTGTNRRIYGAAFGIAFSCVDETIHEDLPASREVEAIDISKACEPVGALVVNAGAGELEELEWSAFVVRVDDASKF